MTLSTTLALSDFLQPFVYLVTIPSTAWAAAKPMLYLLGRASDKPGLRGALSRLTAFFLAALVLGLPMWKDVSEFVAKFGDAQMPYALRLTAFSVLLAIAGAVAYMGHFLARRFRKRPPTAVAETAPPSALSLHSADAKCPCATSLALQGNLSAQQANLFVQKSPAQTPENLLALQSNLSAQQANLVALQLAAALSSKGASADNDPTP